ncbi:hypothetical protein ASG29_09140 [Sphingomonas sp. Leaf412]|uniref:peptidylprolyl isomerase n=1 Tax=Sphingomonas sp. Leaf412 TaxID=1736370 RepID=UPI0006F5FC29|nr:peptidylprolyl isomerase [Sphingomonas sp. Leaf412]KQT32013.1 hypothetical protein ASG29_09140 [Sphingomonas sp. Leaf412]
MLTLMLSMLMAATPDPDAGRAAPPAAAGSSVAALLDRGAEVGRPFPAKHDARSMATQRNTGKAASIQALAAAARRRGLDRATDVVAAEAAFRDMLLAEKLMQTLTDTIVIDEAEVRSRFDRDPDRYDEFDISHIFIPSGADARSDADRNGAARARAVVAKLRQGSDFAALARETSADGTTAADGGRLPLILGADIQPTFMAAIAPLKDGQISDVVKGTDGYHVIRLNQRRHAYSGPARDRIEREIRTREMERLLPKVHALATGAE